MSRVTLCTLLARPIPRLPYLPQLTFAGATPANRAKA
jgi:hypothetical protein